MDKQIVILMGDSAIKSALDDGLILDLIVRGSQVILISSDHSMISGAEEFVHRYPLFVQLVELAKSEAVTEAGWNDPSLLSDAQRSFRYDERELYRAGSSAGAQTRPDAALRAILVRQLGAAFWQALRQAAIQVIAEEAVKVYIVIVDTTYRMTGSGAFVPAIGRLQAVSGGFADQIEQLRVDVLVGARSVETGEPAASHARFGRLAAYAELVLAEERQITVGPELTLRPDFIANVIEIGAPGRGNGMIEDEIQARRALALAVRCYLTGGVGEELKSHYPFLTEQVTARVPATGERRRFAGLGAVEIVLEPRAAAEYFVAYVLCNLPPPR